VNSILRIAHGSQKIAPERPEGLSPDHFRIAEESSAKNQFILLITVNAKSFIVNNVLTVKKKMEAILYWIQLVLGKSVVLEIKFT
jgi:hypothetical protein